MTDISPKDTFAFVGDKLTYQLELTDAAYFPLSEVSIEITPERVRGGPFLISLTEINGTHGYVEINVTEGIGGRTNLNCVHNGTPVCAAKFIVESK